MLSIVFVLVAVRPWYVTLAVAVPEPWSNGTVHDVLNLPLLSVVPVKFTENAPNTMFTVAVAPATGAPFCETYTPIGTICR